MSAYRFCRTDDIGLLVDALNRCWVPCFPGEPLMTPAEFKRSIRDLQVWCSSCMVAFSGSDPIGVLIGAKRAAGTLVHKIAVHPEHQRQGHGRHLLRSLGSKLAILGPPRICSEIPQDLPSASALFRACGYEPEAILTDYVFESDENRMRSRVEHGPRFVIPVAVDDLAANDILSGNQPTWCWERSVETLTARKGDITGLALASDERIDAYLLYTRREAEGEILSLRSLAEDGPSAVEPLLYQLGAQGVRTLRFPKVHPEEVPTPWLERLGFRAQGTCEVYAATARSD